MFSVSTDISIYPLSTLFESTTANYVNSARSINDLYSSSSVSGINLKSLTFSDTIKDVLIDKNYTLLLSDYASLSSFVSTNYNISSYSYGNDDGNFVCSYDTTSGAFIQKDIEYINNQYIVILDNNLNFLPLKTFDNIGYGLYENFKEYQKIYKKNKPFIQYKITSLPKRLEPDSSTTIYNSFGIASSPISSSSFISQGAIGGSCPLNSDTITFNSEDYEIYSDLGDGNINTIENGTLLCLWLSSQTYETSSNKIWMERWYDPNTGYTNITPYLHVLSSDLNYIVDTPTHKILSPKERFEYTRHGPNRNTLYIENIKNNILNISSWSSSFSQGHLSGYLVNFDSSDDVFNMNGNSYGVITPTDELVKNELGVSMWVYPEHVQDTQLFGNHYNDAGYSLYLNTSNSSDSVVIPSESGNCFSMNYRGFKIFEKNILEDLGLSSINIKYTNVDINGNAWLYDDFNNKLYRLEKDNIISYQTTLPVDSSISKIKNFSDNSFALLDSTYNNISSFDSTGIFLSSYTISDIYNTFDIKSDDTIHFADAEFLLFDNYDREIKIIGATLYVDNVKILHLIDKPSSIAIDIHNNIWMLIGKNLLKVNVEGDVLFSTMLDLNFTDYTSSAMSFVSNNLGEFNLWIVFNNASYVIVLSPSGVIQNRIPLNKIGKLVCSTYSFNVNGDFSNFENIRKFNKLNGEVISNSNPSITLKISTNCGISTTEQIIHTDSISIQKWSHIAFTFTHLDNSTHIKLYINGRLQKHTILNGIHTIRYNSPSSPFIIGDYSGKLGPRSLEKSISKSNFFTGKISNLNIYNTGLSDFDIQALSRQKYCKWDGIFVNMPIPAMTLIEDIDKVNINRYKGYKTNKFNIVIKNFTEDISLQNYVTSYIKNNIKQLIPANTALNDIIFE